MSKPNGRRLKLAELRAQGMEALRMEPGFEIELEDGSTITVPHPLLIDDETQSRVQDSVGAIGLAKALLGDEEHARFVKAGGHSADITLAWNLLRQEAEEAGPKLAR